MPISECCNMSVVCCEADATIPQVAELMRRHHVGDVVVIESKDGNRIPLGIVTDRDIVVEMIAMQLDIDVFTAGDIMTEPVVSVRENAGIIETLRLMRAHKIRRVPVVNQAGSLFGIVSADDLINLLAMEFSMMTGVIVEQPIQESRLRRSGYAPSGNAAQPPQRH